jgi:hypothetical protein
VIAKCTDCGAGFPRKADESWKRLCIRCWRKAKGLHSTPAPPEAASPIDATRLRQLIQLAHPDRHGGSALANEVTAWLLSLRKGARA